MSTRDLELLSGRAHRRPAEQVAAHQGVAVTPQSAFWQVFDGSA